MTVVEVDRYLGGTPCVCGDCTNWHPECYAGKTDAQVTTEYRRVYARIRRRIFLQGQAAAKAAMQQMGHSGRKLFEG